MTAWPVPHPLPLKPKTSPIGNQNLTLTAATPPEAHPSRLENRRTTPRRNPQKNFRKVTFFQSSKPTIQNTITNHEITTTSPQKTITKTHVFPKPLQKSLKNHKKKPRP
jgi:hypothetical protein